MTREIQLTKGFVAIVDDEDYERVSRYNWWAETRAHTVYARGYVAGSRQRAYLHRFLLGDVADGLDVDHRDGNGLNNTRSNIRAATRSENLSNARLTRQNKSGSKNVTWDARTSRWRAQVRVCGKSHWLGRFETREAAEVACRAFREEQHAGFANHGEVAVQRPDSTRSPREHARNTSGFRGVSLNRRTGRWVAQIKLSGQAHHLGYFDTPEAADVALRAFREQQRSA